MKLFLIGFMGSGKSTVGKQIANLLNIDFYDLDELIEDKFKMSISLFFQKFDEKTFRDAESNALTEILKNDNFVLSCGGGTPCFNNNMKLINNNGISIYLKMNASSLAYRLEKSRKKRPLLQKFTGENLRNRIEQLLSEREPYYNQAQYVVNGLNVDIKWFGNINAIAFRSKKQLCYVYV